MKGHVMKILGLCLLLTLLPTMCWAESESQKPEEQKPEEQKPEEQEPTLYDHYHAMKRLQEAAASRTIDEQARFQPLIQKEQRLACERLRKDHRKRVQKEEYRRQGGDEFLVFSWELEQWCGTLR
jgi:hypothetical protein